MRTYAMLLAFLGLTIAPPSAGQDFPVPFDGLATDMAMNALHSSMLNSMLEQNDDEPATETRAAVETGYAASAAVSAQAQRQFIAFVRETSGAAGAEAVELEFRKASPSQIWAGMVAGDGLRPGDAVDAVAGYWMLNWIIANRAHETDFDTRPILIQARLALSQNGGFRALTEAQRQELSEVLMMNFLIQQAVYSDAVAKGNEPMQAALADAAVARFRNEAGVDLRAITVTDRGFASR